MVRGCKKEEKAVASNPEAEEKKRLKKLAFSKGILSESQSRVSPSTALAPSKIVVKHHGTDIVRKSQRKNRFLFSFPGLFAPISGGKIGELKNLGTQNPILYLDFPQGQMKLFGTIVYPKNRYLTLQFSRGGKSVMCEDCFDNMIVFSDAWWIGKKDDNPEELRLEFPKDLSLAQEEHREYDFKGGAGAAGDDSQVSRKTKMKNAEPDTPQDELKDDLTESQNNVKKSTEVTPTRHSARNSGKKFNFVEPSSGDDFIGNDSKTFEEEDENTSLEQKAEKCTSTETKRTYPLFVDNVDDSGANSASEDVKQIAKSKDISSNNHISLVQTTVSTLFKKVAEKKANEDVKHKKDNVKVSKILKRGKKTEERDSGAETMTLKTLPESTRSAEVNQRKSKSNNPRASSSRKRKADRISASKFSDSSSSSQDTVASDEDWIA